MVLILVYKKLTELDAKTLLIGKVKKKLIVNIFLSPKFTVFQPLPKNICIHPVNGKSVVEKSQLAFGIVAGMLFDQSDCFIKVNGVVEILKQFLVSHRLQCGCSFVGKKFVILVIEQFSLLAETSFKHLVSALVDTLIERVAGY